MKRDWLRLIGFISSSDVETPHKDNPNTYVAERDLIGGMVTAVVLAGDAGACRDVRYLGVTY